MSTVSSGYAEGPGGYYNPSDGSGPYSIDANGNPTLISGSSARQQLGYRQITSLTSATGLSVPTGATVATVTVEGAPVRWRADGTAPTATVGNPLPVGAIVTFSGGALVAQFIQQSSGASLSVQFEA